MEKPKCKCGNEGISFFKGRIVCGECLVKFCKREDEAFWEIADGQTK